MLARHRTKNLETIEADLKAGAAFASLVLPEGLLEQVSRPLDGAGACSLSAQTLAASFAGCPFLARGKVMLGNAMK